MEDTTQKRFLIQYVLTGIIIVIFFLIGVFIGQLDFLTNVDFPANFSGEKRSVSNEQIDYGLIEEVQMIMNQYYLDTTPDEVATTSEIETDLIKGLIKSYDDRFTSYYSPEEWEELQKENSGEFEGIGIRITSTDDYPLIESAILGTPAQLGGLQAQDLILEVDGTDTLNLTVSEVAKLIRGERGTNVNLEVYRESDNDTLSFDITRSEINIDSVISTKLNDNTTQIQITQFTEGSVNEFQQQWNRAVEDVLENGSENVVLDLRNNTGGWVIAAEFVLEDFIEPGQIILIEEDNDGNRIEKKTTDEARLGDKNVVVLINEGSASASEIVAGALQDLGKAELVGKSTVGKGVEQTIQRLSNGGRIFVVFKKWLTPNGTNLSKDSALTPDYEVDLTTEDFKNGDDPQLDRALDLLN